MFHREGHKIIIFFLSATIIDIILLEYFFDDSLIITVLQLLILSLLVLILQFFRNPQRNTKINKGHILSPVDGKIVIIEKVFENAKAAISTKKPQVHWKYIVFEYNNFDD